MSPPDNGQANDRSSTQAGERAARQASERGARRMSEPGGGQGDGRQAVATRRHDASGAGAAAATARGEHARVRRSAQANGAS